MLFDSDIRREIAYNNIVITPFAEANLGPASYDVTLSNTFKRVKRNLDRTPHMLGGIGIVFLDKDNSDLWIEEVATHGYIVVAPCEFILCSTVERFELSPSISAFIVGRSSVARYGNEIESAGFGDPGWSGQWTLELYNKFPYTVALPVGMRIGQVVFFKGNTPSNNPYAGKYVNQYGPTTSRLFEDFQI